MSGLEPFAVLGVISSIIGIIDATAKLCDAAKDSYGRHAALRKMSLRLPMVISTLQEAHKTLLRAQLEFEQTSDVAKRAAIGGSIELVSPIFGDCEREAAALKDLLSAMVPTIPLSTGQRYIRAIQTTLSGKERRAEQMYKGIRDNLELLRDRQFYLDSNRFNQEAPESTRSPTISPALSRRESVRVVSPHSHARPQPQAQGSVEDGGKDIVSKMLLGQCTWNNAGQTKVQNQGVQILQGGQTIHF